MERKSKFVKLSEHLEKIIDENSNIGAEVCKILDIHLCKCEDFQKRCKMLETRENAKNIPKKLKCLPAATQPQGTAAAAAAAATAAAANIFEVKY